MMANYTVSNSAYPQQFLQQLTVPVITDSKQPPPATMGASPLPATLVFSFDEAISMADRHLFIQGRPANPVQMVCDWTNVLRWESSVFWSVDPTTNWYGHNTGGPYHFTSEHPTHSGELIAEGIAIKLLTSWLGIPRQAVWFLPGTGARPDYQINMIHGGSQYGVEVRCRRSPPPLVSRQARTYLFAPDYKSLAKKKAGTVASGLAATLGIYCYYGLPANSCAAEKPRIHLADPPAQIDALPSEREVIKHLIRYYTGVTSRIGLWSHLEHLERARELLDGGLAPEPAWTGAQGRWPFGYLAREAEGQQYRGRWFSSMILSWQRQELSRAEIVALLQAGVYGTVTYHGVNERVLQFIEQCQWTALLDFFDPATAYISNAGLLQHVTSDGVLKLDYRVTDPDSRDARDVRASLDLE
ncbi:MAG: hypothetical protein HN742_26380 [Lentisphaerae bacterium]|jgi:hypothetical protein|nr:hypothetical protein [Lentisphaerota bacterium]MBT4820297.1 hypothetical protein [Lentisphaerota bacterium]MBT5605990.1 hypothetical protein [Lentisphaerota bacterium]MBT7058621.1 hypothetical protein [Lentisphaerota bacterium]MBT7845429.1 hypothetical protein [Lentisphaerota bacterium]